MYQDSRTSDELRRQRPDGIFIDWAKRAFAILEFTRPYDSTRKVLLDTDKRKRNRYEQLLRKLQELLPGWEGTIVTFSLGVRGTVLEPQWKQELRSLNIQDHHHWHAGRMPCGMCNDRECISCVVEGGLQMYMTSPNISLC